jgi:transposase InsO family protein
VERLMRANRWRGTTRSRKVRTTVANSAATRAPDLVNRHFPAAAPGLLPVAEFTYVPLAGGEFGYTASSSMPTPG